MAVGFVAIFAAVMLLTLAACYVIAPTQATSGDSNRLEAVLSEVRATRRDVAKGSVSHSELEHIKSHLDYQTKLLECLTVKMEKKK